MAVYERAYEGQEAHTVTLFGTDWELPLVEVEAGTYIASDARLVLGTTEFIEAAARRLANRLADRQPAYLVTPEAKALPLAQALARHLEIEYAVVRKHVKEYMRAPTTVPVESITTAGEQQLVLDGPVATDLRGERVALIDDAVSTGGTMQALERLCDAVGAEAVARAAIFEEGQDHPAVETLARLPLFIAD